MKVLLTGAGGQLGYAVNQHLLKAGHRVMACDRSRLDLQQTDAIEKFVAGNRPDWVINCAAYTQVDRAESEAETAFIVNRDAAGRLAAAASSCGARLLHVSTDYVFDGSQDKPYLETDAPTPASIYGRSKYEGELAVIAEQANAVILRTAWVYSAQGKNFARTMLRLSIEGKPLRVVGDQRGTPTWTRDIADVIARMIETEAGGLYHFTAAGSTSWYGFASAVLAAAAEQGFDIVTRDIEKITTADYPTAAKRPASSVLDTGKIESLLSFKPPEWRDSLARMMGELKSCADYS